jgi:glycosyltransferase involved in cell wall biosynthesis
VKLIVINYSMSSGSVVFSHQRDLVFALSQFFGSIEVFTAETSSEKLPKNVKVHLLPWRISSPLKNAATILRTIYPVLMKDRNSIVFTHMTDIHAALISPLTWILRMRHVLWYAHAKNSKYLLWSSFFVSKIVSSTLGSCNLRFNTKKISFINQGVSQDLFPYFSRPFQEKRKILYYGRLDPSKNIHLFSKLIDSLNGPKEHYSLSVYGMPANPESRDYFLDITTASKPNKTNNAITFNGPITRKSISGIARNHEIFLNLFSGSLDKTLIEATFMGLAVVTWNRGYCMQFGTWSHSPVEETLEFISREIVSLRSLRPNDLQKELARRLELAIRNHSFEAWVDRLVMILRGD